MGDPNVEGRRILQYRWKRPFKVPLFFTAIALVCALLVTPLSLSAIPFIWLAAVYASPSPNAVDGCFILMLTSVGTALILHRAPHSALGVILISPLVILSWILSSFETSTTMTPVYEDEVASSDEGQA